MSSGRNSLRVLSLVLATALILLALALWWLLFTGSGAQFSLALVSSRYQQQCDCTLDYHYESGSLWQGLNVDQLHYDDQDTALTVQRLVFNWSPWQLTDRQLLVSTLQVDGLSLSLPESSDDNSEPLSQEQLQSWLFALPVAIQLDQFYGSRLQIQSADGGFSLEVLEASATLDAQSLELDVQTLQVADAELSGTLILNEKLQLDSHFSWSFQAGELFGGELDVGGDLQEVRIRHSLQEPLSINSEGTLQTALFTDAGVTFSLQHQARSIVLDKFGLATGSMSDLMLDTAGDFQVITLSGSSLLSHASIQPVQINFNADYQLAAARLSVSALNLLSEQVDASVSGQYQFTDGAVQLDWELRDFNNSDLLEGFSFSNVSGAGHLALSQEPVQSAEITLQNISGLLNEYPLSINGSLVLADSLLQSVNLQINSGENRLQVSGAAGPELNIDWRLQAPAIEQSWTSLHGSLNGGGQVLGSYQQPVLAGAIQGSDLLLLAGRQQFYLSEVQATANAAPEIIEQLSVQLGRLVHINDKGVEVPLMQSASLNAGGTVAEHSLSASLVSAHPRFDGSFTASVSGAWQNGQWQGLLDESGLQSEALGDWQLQDSVSVNYVAEQWQLSEHCWAYAELKVCSQAQSQAEGISAGLQLSGLPLEWFNKGQRQQPVELERLQALYGVSLPDNISVSGKADLNFDIQGFRDGSWNSLALSVEPQALVLQITEQADSDDMTMIPEQNHFALDNVVLSVKSRNQQWQGTAGFRVTQLYEDQGVLPALQGDFAGLLTLDAQQNLQGEIEFEFADLAWLETLMPEMKTPGGNLNGVALISGTRSQPEVTAELVLQEGHFQLPAYGLDVQAVQVELNATQDEAHLSLSATSGEGALEIIGLMTNPFAQNRGLEIDIEGEDFLLISHDNLHFSVSPQLNLELDQGVMSVTGKVLVPELDLKLDAYLAEAVGDAVNVSRDVVVVNGDDDALVYTSSQNLGLRTNLTLSLGEQVHVSGFGLNADLGGELRLEQEANRALFAYGELGVRTGTYQFYGQTLNTDGGRLMFYGNVLNPVLDMKAYRQTATAEVGVQLRGNINAIEGRLYSTPSLPDNEILSLLATGKSFNSLDNNDNDALLSAVATFGLQKSGKLTGALGDKLGLDSLAISTGNNYQESALGVGKYLTPDLMMRYEVGLFDRRAVLSLDYRLTERLKLEVKTGLSQSVDFTYTVEKD